MDGWKSRGGKSQRREEKRRGEKRREEKKEEDQRRERVGARTGRKVAKHYVANDLWLQGVEKFARKSGGCGAMWEMKSYTPLWREAHFQVKIPKTPHFWTTFGSCDVEKVHDARSTFGSCDVEKVRNTFRCQNCEEIDRFRPLLRSNVVSRGKGFLAFQKKTMAGMGHFKRICKDAFHMASAVQETCSSEMLVGPGALFFEKDCIFEHQIYGFAKIIFRDRCSTSYDLASLFPWKAQCFRQMKWKIAKRRGRQLCTQFCILEGSLVEWLRFWCCQVRNFGSLAELLCFWCCPVWKWSKSRRIASLSSLQIDR